MFTIVVNSKQYGASFEKEYILKSSKEGVLYDQKKVAKVVRASFEWDFWNKEHYRIEREISRKFGDDLRDFGVKTEFLGRVGLIFNTQPLSLDTLFNILEESPLLANYLNLFDRADRESSILRIKAIIQKMFENNTLGARMINTIIHQYFIKGGKIDEKTEKTISFTKKMEL